MRLLFVVIFSLFSAHVYAACSAFQSDVTINEMYRESGNNKPAFIEIKLLSSFSGSSADYNNWTIKICHDNNDCKVIDVDDLTVSGSWLHTDDGTDEFDIADYLDFKDGFDLAILDNDDKFIDYIQIHNYQNGQYTNFNNDCGYDDLSYVNDIPSTDITNGTVILFRTPDGTGQWFEDKNLNQSPLTPGANNEGVSQTIAQCSAIFPSGAQTYTDSGAISFFNANDQIINNPSLNLATKTVYHYNGAINTCGSGNCISANVIAEQVNNINFTANSNNIALYNSDELTLTPGNYNELSITHSSKLILTAGDYYFNHYVNTYENAEIILDGSGVVRIFANNNIGIRTKVNDGGDATQLLLFSTKEISLFEGSTTNAFLVSKEDSIIKSTLTGAVNSKNVYFFDGQLTYESTEPDFGNYCDGEGSLPPSGPATLALHFDFNEGSGQISADSSGNNRDGILGTNFSEESNDPDWSCNVNTDGYLIFDRTENNIVTVPEFTPPSEGAVAFWLRVPQAVSSAERIFGFSNSWEARLENDGKIYWDINETGRNEVTIFDFDPSDYGQWVHFAFVTDTANDTWQYYVNGTLVDSGTSDVDVQSAASLTLGTRTGSSDYFSGSIDDFRIYSTIPTAAEISDLAQNKPALEACGTCNINFSHGAQTYTDAGKVRFEWDARIDNSPSTSLNTKNIEQSIYDVNSCTTADCEASGILAEQIEYNDFPVNNNDVTLYNELEQVLAPGNYNAITLSGTSKVYLSAGDYILSSSMNLYNDSELIITGGGVVRMFVQSGVGLHSNVNVSGDATQLLIYSPADINLYYGSNTKAFITTRTDFNLHSTMTGAVIAENVILQSSAVLIYETDAPDFGDLCSSSDPVIDHYQIIHNSTGLTCAAETATIKACTNSSNSSCTESTQAVTLDLLIDGSSDVTKSSINFTGSTDVSFNYTLAEPVSLSIQNATVAATSSVFCSDASFNDTNCQMSFVDTGFRFLFDGNLGISHQLSGKDSDTGYNAAAIVIQAIEKNNASGACQGVVINQEIEFAAQCTNPAVCSSALSVDNVDIPTSSASPSSYQAIDVGFNGSDTAEIVLNYPDAGALSLYARYNIPVNGSPSGSYMTGDASFTVRPFGFDVEVTGNPKAANASGDKFIAAGEEFAVTLTAKQWQAADDINNDGIPDDGADLSNNSTVKNFSGKTAVLNHSLVKPVGGVIGTLSDNTFDNFVNSSQTKNLSWNEVGIIRFDFNLSDNDYLGAGDIQGNVPFVGRFTPAHYKQTVQENGVLAGECGAWAYAGQKDAATQLSGAIKYSLQPELIITAYASNGIDITKNFTLGDGTAAEDFNKLSVASIVLADGVNDDGIINDKNQLGKSGDLVTLSANWATATLTEHDSEQGKLRYTFSDLDHYTYLKNANSEIAPFTAEIPLVVESITDSDGITQGADASDLAEAIATGVEIKFGRLLVKNSYGPETSPQPIPMQIEYLADSGKYTVNSEDNCTVVATNNSEMQITDINLGGATPTITQTSQAVSEGLVDFLQLTPQSTNRGKVQLNYQIYPWLGYDWLNNGDFTTAPEAIATFGLFRGNDRIIQWREINP